MPTLGRIIGSALTLDAEFMDGPVAGDSLAADSFAATQRATVAAGLAIEDLKNVVPLTAHVRYLHSRVHSGADRSFVDVGVAASSNLDWIFWRGGKPFPFGVRLSYAHLRETSEGEFREHEFGGGLYYFGRDKTRVGLDFEASFQRHSEDLKARRLGAMLRIDYYWGANH